MHVAYLIALSNVSEYVTLACTVGVYYNKEQHMLSGSGRGSVIGGEIAVSLRGCATVRSRGSNDFS